MTGGGSMEGAQATSAPAPARVEASSALPRSTTLPSSLAMNSARSGLFSIIRTS